MAYVAISGHLIERVKSKIEKMKTAELDTLGKFEPVVSPNEPFIGKTVWGEHLHLKDKMPAEWLNTTKEVYATFKIDDKTLSHKFSLSSETTMPPKMSYYQGKEIDITDSHPVVQSMVTHYTKVTEVNTRWDGVQEKVVGFLNAAKSLNEAVKLWPDVHMYLAAEDVDRMGVKREKARESDALKALAGMDVGALVGAAVIARMSGAPV